ncbi:hypothetical protein [Prevotella sp. S7 MS 2]|nr:hypothetical protein [Prevotella sp. S7 MS 2]
MKRRCYHELGMLKQPNKLAWSNMLYGQTMGIVDCVFTTIINNR